MASKGYLRFPTIQRDTVVFVSDDDLWRVPAGGGAAQRLTAGLSEPAAPCLSADGRWIAFTGRDELHPEVYLMPALGGPARRLTWLGGDVITRGYTPRGDILFVTTQGQPFVRNYRAFTLDVEGGTPQRLPWGQVNHLAWSTGGAIVIGRNTADPARWKRYRGGTAGHLWVDPTGAGDFRRLTQLGGNITSPLWIGDRLYFLSDAEGVGNLYSCGADGSDVRRHTDHGDYYARHAQTDGRRIVYQCGADLWLHDPATDRSARIDIELASSCTQAARRFVAVADHLEAFAPHPAGHSVALTARGRLSAFAFWEGAVRLHGTTAGRRRLGQWLADGTTLIAVSDASGEERIEVATAEGTRELSWDTGRVVTLVAAPRGRFVAFANHRNEVWIGDVDAEAPTRVDRSDAGRSDDLAWSPDALWLAYTYWTSSRHCAIKLFDLAQRSSVLVTRPEFRDYCPAFDPTGRHLYFLSLRTFDPVYDSVQFELSFPRAGRPYLIALQPGGAPPFDPPPRSVTGDDKANEPAPAAPAFPAIVVAGIERRIAPFPVPENRFGQIAGVRGGKVLWTVLPIVGAHGRGGHKEAPGRLEVFDFATRETRTLTDKCDRFALAGNHATLVIREGKRLRVLAADRASEGDSSTAPPGDEPSRKTGWIDIGRVRLAVDPRAEWRQMLREVWRLQRDQFWSADISGVDWDAVYQTYAPLVDRVATRGELSDLIWELQGELGTSHAYEMGGDHRRPPAVALGFLAAELRYCADDRSYEIEAIVDGDAWDAGADSPLNAIGVEAKLGERIVAVNGQPTTRELPPQALLVHQAGASVELTLAQGHGDARTTRNVVVKALADEVPARYREWVERNRRAVHAQSADRVGYIHLPDMMSAGFAEFHRYFSAECDRDALVVDVRYNRGGHVSQLLLEKIARRRIGYDLSRWGQPLPYPELSVAGPVVALTNEHAGSDGDIFSHAFKRMGIGPLVGTRTWGGVIGIWPRHALVDGTETTQPEFSFWFDDVGWGVENFGTEPQIAVDNAPQDARAGRDRQLEVAVATALERIAATGVSQPAFGPRPDLRCPPLPPRP
jgi:tricorn protease